MPSAEHNVLKITTTDTYKIKHPDEIELNVAHEIDTNRAALEKMLPQFSGKPLGSWVCPFVFLSPPMKKNYDLTR